MSDFKKQCRICKEVKFLSYFYKRTEAKDGYQSRCKQCYKEQYSTKEWKEYKRDYNLKYMYSISLTQYKEMVKKQNGVCAICQCKCNQHKRLSVDHCHNTGKIRGLLCAKCNKGIGLLNHNSDLLIKASLYVNVL